MIRSFGFPIPRSPDSPYDQRRVLVPCQPLEPEQHGARGGRRLVHDHQPEGAGPQHHVGAPPGTLGAAGPDYPERAEGREVRGGLGRQGPRGIHEGDPFVAPQRGLGEGEEQRGAAAPQRRVERGDLSPRHARREQPVEGRNPE